MKKSLIAFIILLLSVGSLSASMTPPAETLITPDAACSSQETMEMELSPQEDIAPLEIASCWVVMGGRVYYICAHEERPLPDYASSAP